jgi:hypothetical protein
LEGSTMTLSALDGAKKEFGIAFANLSEAAKQFLDSKIAEDNLTQILERKGIIIHTLTTTTQAQPIVTDADNRFNRDDQRDQQEQQRQRQNQTFDSEDTA